MKTKSLRWAAALIVALSFQVVAADKTDVAMLEQLAAELAEAAPAAKADDAAAYSTASRKLLESKLLERISSRTILWGGQAAGRGIDPAEYNLTEFDPLIWRGEYLAEFMFAPKHAITRIDDYTVLSVDCSFRNRMDPGNYPYPFWHSLRKWQSYQQATRVLFLFKKNKLIAGYRSSEEDAGRPVVARTFDGNWHWSSKDHSDEPHVSLYENLFSKDNPHLADLEAAYRKLESTSRKANCMGCHSPDNKSQAKKLIILAFPNQALSARHTLVKQIEDNLMPPKDQEKNTPAGIADAQEKARLIEIAKTFTAEADKALEFESSRIQQR